MPKRKYLFYTRAPSGGGAEVTWARLASAFADQGHEVVLAVDQEAPGAVGPNVRVVPVGAGNLTGTVRLARLIRRFRPDVALSALSGNAVKLAAARLLGASGVPIVISFHGAMEHRTGRLAALAYRGLPLLSRIAARIVAVSDGLRATLVETWGADPRKTVRLYNPVPRQIPVEGGAALAGRPPLVAAIGRLSPEKGFDLLVDAFALVRTEDARLVIAGEGPERGAIEERIAAGGLADRIRLAGFVDPASLYAAARLVVVPSRSEAFGLVAVEALSAGLPLVVTDCDGPREIVDQGRFGTIVPVGDAGAMAAAIDAALADPGDPAPRVDRARLFSLEAGVAAWSELLEQVARGG